MNREQTLKSDLQMKTYMEKHKLRHLFAELTKEVLLKRPDDPISYLINYIGKRNKRQIVCIQGYDEETRSKISTSVSIKFNYGHINLSALFKEDYHLLGNEDVSRKVLEEFKKIDPIFKGVIISGYPNNASQADHLHKSGILPDRYFVMQTSPEYLKKLQSMHSPQDFHLLQTRSQLEGKELRQSLGEQIDNLPQNIDNAIDKITSTLGVKAKKVTPYESPRVVLLHPPYLLPKTLPALIDKFSIHHISLNKQFTKHTSKEAFRNYVSNQLRQAKCLSKEMELALIETACKSAAAKNKGLMVTGWPTKKASLPFLKNHFLNPHIIFIFNLIKQKGYDEYSKLDPQDSSLFTMVQKPSEQEYHQQWKEYTEIVDELKSSPNVQMLPLHESQLQVLKTFESLLDNPRIYS